MKKLILIPILLLSVILNGQVKLKNMSNETSLDGTELLYIVDGSTDKKLVLDTLLNAVSDTANQVRSELSDSINGLRTELGGGGGGWTSTGVYTYTSLDANIGATDAPLTELEVNGSILAQGNAYVDDVLYFDYPLGANVPQIYNSANTMYLKDNATGPVSLADLYSSSTPTNMLSTIGGSIGLGGNATTSTVLNTGSYLFWIYNNVSGTTALTVNGGVMGLQAGTRLELYTPTIYDTLLFDGYTHKAIPFVWNDTLTDDGADFYYDKAVDRLYVDYLQVPAYIYTSRIYPSIGDNNNLGFGTGMYYQSNAGVRYFGFYPDSAASDVPLYLWDGLFVNDTNIYDFVAEHGGSGGGVGGSSNTELLYNNSGSVDGISNLKLIASTLNLQNAGSDTGFYIHNNSTGRGLQVNNTTTGYGIRTNNSSSGYGIWSSNTGSGQGITATNSGTGGSAVYVDNSGTGQGIVINNSSSNNGLRINTTSTGNSLELARSGIDVLSVYDSLYIDYINPGQEAWALFTSTGALDSANFGGASEALYTDIPTIYELLKTTDKNGEIKWFYKDHWSYDLTGSNGGPKEQIYKLQSGIEIAYRYILEQTEINKIQNDRLTILEQDFDELKKMYKTLNKKHRDLETKYKRCRKCKKR